VIGRRNDSDRLKPGEYGKHPVDGHWFARTPNGHLGNLSAHDVTEHADGTITVHPSILVSSREDGKEVECWHGYLEAGVWREVS
jgi:hypothetical protein